MLQRHMPENTEMAWFIFAGDLLVMFFMTMLVVWVSMRSSRELLDFSANIPLLEEDEHD
jgi:hypothetical protein